MRSIIMLATAFILIGTGFSFAASKSGAVIEKGQKPHEIGYVAQQIEAMVAVEDYIHAAREIDRYWAFFQGDKMLSERISKISSQIDPKVRIILSAINHVQATSANPMVGRFIIFIDQKDFSRLKSDSELSASLSSAIENNNSAVVIILWEGKGAEKFSETLFIKGEKLDGYLKLLKDAKEGARVNLESETPASEALNKIFYKAEFSFGELHSDDGQPIKVYKVIGGL